MEDNQDSKLLNINILIGDRSYPMKVKADEEAGIRNAAKLVNEKMKSFQHIYEGRDKQDFLAMTALLFAVELPKQEQTQVDKEVLEESLNKLENVMDKF